MKIAFKNSWWVQIPSLIFVAAMLVVPAARWPWPPRVPVHFDAAWHTNRWGSPLEGMAFVLIAPMPLAASFLVSTMWARQERGRKRFNFVVPLVALPLGVLAGISCWYWWHIQELAHAGAAAGAWRWAAIAGATNAAACSVLEMVRRPIDPQFFGARDSDDRTSAGKFPAIPNQSGKWAYFATQRSVWLPRLCAIAGLITLVGALAAISFAARFVGPIRFIALLPSLILLCVAPLVGSLQVLVNSEQLIVRAGLFRTRLLRLQRGDITSVQVESFSPLLDFGGWGIRYAAGTWAYIFTGNRGVRLETREGKRYVIGSGEPDKLAAALGVRPNPITGNS